MVALTLAEAAEVLDPPMTDKQLRQIITALGWKPVGWRRTGHAGRPHATYNASDLMALHGALLPFLTIGDA